MKTILVVVTVALIIGLTKARDHNGGKKSIIPRHASERGPLFRVVEPTEGLYKRSRLGKGTDGTLHRLENFILGKAVDEESSSRKSDIESQQEVGTIAEENPEDDTAASGSNHADKKTDIGDEFTSKKKKNTDLEKKEKVQAVTDDKAPKPEGVIDEESAKKKSLVSRNPKKTVTKISKTDQAEVKQQKSEISKDTKKDRKQETKKNSDKTNLKKDLILLGGNSKKEKSSGENEKEEKATKRDKTEKTAAEDDSEYGSSPGNPAMSCSDLFTKFPNLASGSYWIQTADHKEKMLLFCEKNLNYIKPKLDNGKEWKPKEKEGAEQSPGQPAPPPPAPKLGAKGKKVIAHLVVGDHLPMGDNKDIEAGPEDPDQLKDGMWPYESVTKIMPEEAIKNATELKLPPSPSPQPKIPAKEPNQALAAAPPPSTQAKIGENKTTNGAEKNSTTIKIPGNNTTANESGSKIENKEGTKITSEGNTTKNDSSNVKPEDKGPKKATDGKVETNKGDSSTAAKAGTEGVKDQSKKEKEVKEGDKNTTETTDGKMAPAQPQISNSQSATNGKLVDPAKGSPVDIPKNGLKDMPLASAAGTDLAPAKQADKPNIVLNATSSKAVDTKTPDQVVNKITDKTRNENMVQSNDLAPIQEPAPNKEAAPNKDMAQSKLVEPGKETAAGNVVAPNKGLAPNKALAPSKELSPNNELLQNKVVAPAKELGAGNNLGPNKELALNKELAPSKELTTNKESAQNKVVAPSNELATGNVQAPNKELAPNKALASNNNLAPIKDIAEHKITAPDKNLASVKPVPTINPVLNANMNAKPAPVKNTAQAPVTVTQGSNLAQANQLPFKNPAPLDIIANSVPNKNLANANPDLNVNIGQNPAPNKNQAQVATVPDNDLVHMNTAPANDLGQQINSQHDKMIELSSPPITAFGQTNYATMKNLALPNIKGKAIEKQNDILNAFAGQPAGNSQVNELSKPEVAPTTSPPLKITTPKPMEVTPVASANQPVQKPGLLVTQFFNKPTVKPLVTNAFFKADASGVTPIKPTMAQKKEPETLEEFENERQNNETMANGLLNGPLGLVQNTEKTVSNGGAAQAAKSSNSSWFDDPGFGLLGDIPSARDKTFGTAQDRSDKKTAINGTKNEKESKGTKKEGKDSETKDGEGKSKDTKDNSKTESSDTHKKTDSEKGKGKGEESSNKKTDSEKETKTSSENDSEKDKKNSAEKDATKDSKKSQEKDEDKNEKKSDSQTKQNSDEKGKKTKEEEKSTSGPKDANNDKKPLSEDKKPLSEDKKPVSSDDKNNSSNNKKPLSEDKKPQANEKSASKTDKTDESQKNNTNDNVLKSKASYNYIENKTTSIDNHEFKEALAKENATKEALDAGKKATDKKMVEQQEAIQAQNFKQITNQSNPQTSQPQQNVLSDPASPAVSNTPANSQAPSNIHQIVASNPGNSAFTLAALPLDTASQNNPQFYVSSPVSNQSTTTTTSLAPVDPSTGDRTMNATLAVVSLRGEDGTIPEAGFTGNDPVDWMQKNSGQKGRANAVAKKSAGTKEIDYDISDVGKKKSSIKSKNLVAGKSEEKEEHGHISIVDVRAKKSKIGPHFLEIGKQKKDEADTNKRGTNKGDSLQTKSSTLSKLNKVLEGTNFTIQNGVNTQMTFKSIVPRPVADGIVDEQKRSSIPGKGKSNRSRTDKRSWEKGLGNVMEAVKGENFSIQNSVNSQLTFKSKICPVKLNMKGNVRKAKGEAVSHHGEDSAKRSWEKGLGNIMGAVKGENFSIQNSVNSQLTFKSKIMPVKLEDGKVDDSTKNKKFKKKSSKRKFKTSKLSEDEKSKLRPSSKKVRPTGSIKKIDRKKEERVPYKAKKSRPMEHNVNRKEQKGTQSISSKQTESKVARLKVTGQKNKIKSQGAIQKSEKSTLKPKKGNKNGDKKVERVAEKRGKIKDNMFKNERKMKDKGNHTEASLVSSFIDGKATKGSEEVTLSNVAKQGVQTGGNKNGTLVVSAENRDGNTANATSSYDKSKESDGKTREGKGNEKGADVKGNKGENMTMVAARGKNSTKDGSDIEDTQENNSTEDKPKVREVFTPDIGIMKKMPETTDIKHHILNATDISNHTTNQAMLHIKNLAQHHIDGNNTLHAVYNVKRIDSNGEAGMNDSDILVKNLYQHHIDKDNVLHAVYNVKAREIAGQGDNSTTTALVTNLAEHRIDDQNVLHAKYNVKKIGDSLTVDKNTDSLNAGMMGGKQTGNSTIKALTKSADTPANSNSHSRANIPGKGKGSKKSTTKEKAKELTGAGSAKVNKAGSAKPSNAKVSKKLHEAKRLSSVEKTPEKDRNTIDEIANIQVNVNVKSKNSKKYSTLKGKVDASKNLPKNKRVKQTKTVAKSLKPTGRMNSKENVKKAQNKGTLEKGEHTEKPVIIVIKKNKGKGDSKKLTAIGLVKVAVNNKGAKIEGKKGKPTVPAKQKNNKKDKDVLKSRRNKGTVESKSVENTQLKPTVAIQKVVSKKNKPTIKKTLRRKFQQTVRKNESIKENRKFDSNKVRRNSKVKAGKTSKIKKAIKGPKMKEILAKLKSIKIGPTNKITTKQQQNRKLGANAKKVEKKIKNKRKKASSKKEKEIILKLKKDFKKKRQQTIFFPQIFMKRENIPRMSAKITKGEGRQLIPSKVGEMAPSGEGVQGEANKQDSAAKNSEGTGNNTGTDANNHTNPGNALYASENNATHNNQTKNENINGTTQSMTGNTGNAGQITGIQSSDTMTTDQTGSNIDQILNLTVGFLNKTFHDHFSKPQQSKDKTAAANGTVNSNNATTNTINNSVTNGVTNGVTGATNTTNGVNITENNQTKAFENTGAQNTTGTTSAGMQNSTQNNNITSQVPPDSNGNSNATALPTSSLSNNTGGFRSAKIPGKSNAAAVSDMMSPIENYILNMINETGAKHFENQTTPDGKRGEGAKNEATSTEGNNLAALLSKVKDGNINVKTNQVNIKLSPKSSSKFVGESKNMKEGPGKMLNIGSKRSNIKNPKLRGVNGIEKLAIKAITKSKAMKEKQSKVRPSAELARNQKQNKVNGMVTSAVSAYPIAQNEKLIKAANKKMKDGKRGINAAKVSLKSKAKAKSQIKFATAHKAQEIMTISKGPDRLMVSKAETGSKEQADAGGMKFSKTPVGKGVSKSEGKIQAATAKNKQPHKDTGKNLNEVKKLPGKVISKAAGTMQATALTNKQSRRNTKMSPNEVSKNSKQRKDNDKSKKLNSKVKRQTNKESHKDDKWQGGFPLSIDGQKNDWGPVSENWPNFSVG